MFLASSTVTSSHNPYRSSLAMIHHLVRAEFMDYIIINSNTNIIVPVDIDLDSYIMCVWKVVLNIRATH